MKHKSVLVKPETYALLKEKKKKNYIPITHIISTLVEKHLKDDFPDKDMSKDDLFLKGMQLQKEANKYFSMVEESIMGHDEPPQHGIFHDDMPPK